MKKILASFFVLYTLIINAQSIDLSWDNPSRENNQFRERLCLNGLWKFYPLDKPGKPEDTPPPIQDSGWGYFKVPGVWPQNKPLSLVPDEKLATRDKWHTAWYQRTFKLDKVPENCSAILEIQHVQTRALVIIDGETAGEIIFPGGSLDITKHIKVGKEQVMTLRVSAIPSKEFDFVSMDTNNFFKRAATIKIRGINGDVFLNIVPQARLEAIHYITSVKDKKISFDCGIANLSATDKLKLKAEIGKDGKTVKTFESPEFNTSELKDGRYTFQAGWEDPQLWDTDSPQNIYEGKITLSVNGQASDQTLPEKFGFREFTVEGQNYLLNGKIIHLRAYHLGTYGNFWSADKTGRDFCLETIERLQKLGFNFSIGSNYHFKEGATSYIRGFCEAADQSGWLHSFSMPHPRSEYENKLDDPQTADAYKKRVQYLAQLYWNHPSIIMYATQHNSGSAWGEQAPLRLGTDYIPADSKEERDMKEPSRKNAELSKTIINEVDPTRPVYAHAGGNICGQYTLNTYLNWAPVQERSDWLENYYKHGKMPLAFVEWGLPHIASFSSHRFPDFIWNATAKQTVWDAEYASAFYGDSAAKWTPEREKLLKLIVENKGEAVRFNKFYKTAGNLPDVIRIQSDYFADNLRCMRAWNIGLLLPWDDYANYIQAPGETAPKENPDRFKNLNKPGLVADYFFGDHYALSPFPETFKLSELGETIKKWNQPLIAFIGGDESFTGKEHIYTAGEKLGKTLVILNDKRTALDCTYSVFIKSMKTHKAEGKLTINPGTRALEKIFIDLPEDMKNGKYSLEAEFKFSDKTVFKDSFKFQIIKKSGKFSKNRKSALFDPVGITGKLLDELNYSYEKVTLKDDLSQYEILIIGREALSANGVLPSLDAVKTGQKVLIFEQKNEVMQRLGFRINQYGLRKLFVRNENHPVLKGLDEELFSDWRGEATLIPPMLDYNQFFCPQWNWCGFKNTRVWRCGNRGTVADELIEKPEKGNFMPLLDGGFALQYAPLLEYREGKGCIIFCQVDLSGRTQTEPAAMLLGKNLLDYMQEDIPLKTVKWNVVGGEKFMENLTTLGFKIPEPTESPELLLIGPGAGKYADMTEAVAKGLKLICIGLSETQLESLMPGKIKAVDRKDQSSKTAKLDAPEFAGISNMDTYFQAKLDYASLTPSSELSIIKHGNGSVIICPVSLDALDYEKYSYMRSSFRRRAFMLSRLLHNAGLESSSRLLERFKSPAKETPWLESYYIQKPVAEDDPYRYYHW